MVLTARSRLVPEIQSLPSAQPDVAPPHCHHCGERVPPASHWRLQLDHAEREFCCAGCMGIAQTIRAAGLEAFYARRTAPAGRVINA